MIIFWIQGTTDVYLNDRNIKYDFKNLYLSIRNKLKCSLIKEQKNTKLQFGTKCGTLEMSGPVKYVTEILLLVLRFLWSAKCWIPLFFRWVFNPKRLFSVLLFVTFIHVFYLRTLAIFGIQCIYMHTQWRKKKQKCFKCNNMFVKIIPYWRFVSLLSI